MLQRLARRTINGLSPHSDWAMDIIISVIIIYSCDWKRIQKFQWFIWTRIKQMTIRVQCIWHHFSMNFIIKFINFNSNGRIYLISCIFRSKLRTCRKRSNSQWSRETIYLKDNEKRVYIRNHLLHFNWKWRKLTVVRWFANCLTSIFTNGSMRGVWLHWPTKSMDRSDNNLNCIA